MNIDNLFDEEGERKYVEKSYMQYNHWEVDSEGTVTPLHPVHLEALSKLIKGEPIPSDEMVEGEEIDISIVLGEDHEIY